MIELKKYKRSAKKWVTGFGPDDPGIMQYTYLEIYEKWWHPYFNVITSKLSLSLIAGVLLAVLLECLS